MMTKEQFTKIVEALGREGYGVIRLASFVESKASAPVAKPAAPVEGKTADGRSAYTCGVCGQPGHNARHHTKGATASPTPAAKPAAAPKVTAPAPVVPSMDLGDLSFDLGDLGGSAPVAPKATAPKAPKAAATPAPAPAPEPEPEAAPGEATDAELGSFLDDLDNLLPG